MGLPTPTIGRPDWTRNSHRLEAMPERFGLAPENRLSRMEMRQTFYANFRILFTIRGQAVYVVTIRHGARRFLRRAEIDDLT
jgi:hypothetical protein